MDWMEQYNYTITVRRRCIRKTSLFISIRPNDSEMKCYANIEQKHMLLNLNCWVERNYSCKIWQILHYTLHSFWVGCSIVFGRQNNRIVIWNNKWGSVIPQHSQRTEREASRFISSIFFLILNRVWGICLGYMHVLDNFTFLEYILRT